MNIEYIEQIETYLDMLDNYINQDTKNSLEKINIMTKIEELVFWLEQYKSQYLESKGE